jgi:beta-mannosidase
MKLFRVLLAALLLATAVLGGGLQEDPVIGDDVQRMISLDGDAWTAVNGDGTIAIGATVPGDLISDLQRANMIHDPLFNLTFQEKVWDASLWTYASPPFDVDRIDVLQEVYLVFDGLKMAADVAVNNHHVGIYSDQFLRHVIPVKKHLQSTSNVVTVVFRMSNDSMNNETRWMGCSGGWDWAPYSTTNFIDGTRTFSKGIIKSVYVGI